MIVIESMHEINALSMLLGFVKFECNDEERLLFAASPFINKIHEAVLKEIYNEHKERAGLEDDYLEISKYPQYIDAVLKNIYDTKGWTELKAEIKEKYVCELISPFIADKSLIDQLIIMGDKKAQEK